MKHLELTDEEYKNIIIVLAEYILDENTSDYSGLDMYPESVIRDICNEDLKRKEDIQRLLGKLNGFDPT